MVVVVVAIVVVAAAALLRVHELLYYVNCHSFFFLDIFHV